MHKSHFLHGLHDLFQRALLTMLTPCLFFLSQPPHYLLTFGARSPRVHPVHWRVWNSIPSPYSLSSQVVTPKMSPVTAQYPWGWGEQILPPREPVG